MTGNHLNRPTSLVVLAMSADGKIADINRAAFRFGSRVDYIHLETQVAEADGVLLGATTLRSVGSTIVVSHPELIKQRQQQGKPLQPVHIICSRSGNLDQGLRFFQQPVPRWLLTTLTSAERWQGLPAFEQILTFETPQPEIDWLKTWEYLAEMGLKKLAILGGGQLVSSLLALDLIDEFYLTICPVILGGRDAPTPVDGNGFLATIAPRLELLKVQTVEQEVFLHYRLHRSDNSINLN